ncbi:hypothetical protein cypCar_00048201 [Cyprinus carpio]|nr:hypothetical protein cypCar_00048201 [Cyprinus carpio]
MMRVLAFWTAACVLCARGTCVPLLDEKSADCDSDEVRPAAGCDRRETDEVLNAQERHEGLLKELQELARHEHGYTHDSWEEDEEEGAMKEQNERDLDELLQEEIQRRPDQELERKHRRNQEKEEEEKQEELQELMRKMKEEEEEEKKEEEKREMENASDEATRQFERERNEEEEERRHDEEEEEEDEDEELLEIEAELRKVAAQLHELRRG